MGYVVVVHVTVSQQHSGNLIGTQVLEKRIENLSQLADLLDQLFKDVNDPSR